MIGNKKVVVVLPAYNAAKTLRQTYQEIPLDIVDEVVLTDDKSSDATIELARELGISKILIHKKNLGYGGNQKTCYQKALETKADIIIMLHPDYQYTPVLIPAMAHMIASQLYDIVIASRIIGNGALQGGMPLYKYIGNRMLTFFQNLLLGSKLTEFHTGYRAYTAESLRDLHVESFSNDFSFDNQLLAKAIYKKMRVGEVSCPTRYFEEASSIGFSVSIKYGLQVIKTSLQFWFARRKIYVADFLKD